MKDIFDNKILCNGCGKPMENELISKNGFNIRTIKCSKCNERIIHPSDKIEYENFMRLKEKDFNVKMRMVGNSYAVSIPREIVDFMREQDKMIDDMVRLNFEDMGRLRLCFNTPEPEIRPRAVGTREVKIVRDGKVFHSKEFLDQGNPKNNRRIVLRDELKDKEVRQ